jgi:hypothetical protein
MKAHLNTAFLKYMVKACSLWTNTTAADKQSREIIIQPQVKETFLVNMFDMH